MPTATTRVFKSGNSQAVRLPKGLAYPEGTELTIVRSGDVTTLYPAKQSMQRLVERLEGLPGPGEIEVRDSDLFPERPGL